MFAIASNVRNALPDTLLGFSPYRNGSYLVELPEGLPEEWKLYCCCGRPAICSCWTWSELKSYAVSNEAYLRGYGSPDEVMPMSRSRGLSFIVRQGGRAGSKAN